MQKPRRCHGLHKNRGEEKNEKDIGKFINRTVLQCWMKFICYAFIIGFKYEEKKCINIKQVLNCIIISGFISPVPQKPQGPLSFPPIQEENIEIEEIDIYNPLTLW